MTKGWFLNFLWVAGLGIVVWASDHVTLQGERTIYTVVCLRGAWNGLLCRSRLAAGERYRFRASHTRNEVVYWIAGSSATSGKHTDCEVADRDNWTCNVHEGEPPSIAHQLSHGRPTSRGAGFTVPYCAVAKWKWWVLRAGIPMFARADYCGGMTPEQSGDPS